MRLKNILILITCVALIGLTLSNPSQEKFQKKLVDDFGQFHGGVSLSIDQIMSLGHGNRNSFFIFSTYQYEMGNIGVKYWGIAGQTIFIKSFRKDEQQKEQTESLDSV